MENLTEVTMSMIASNQKNMDWVWEFYFYRLKYLPNDQWKKDKSLDDLYKDQWDQLLRTADSRILYSAKSNQRSNPKLMTINTLLFSLLTESEGALPAVHWNKHGTGLIRNKNQDFWEDEFIWSLELSK